MSEWMPLIKQFTNLASAGAKCFVNPPLSPLDTVKKSSLLLVRMHIFDDIFVECWHVESWNIHIAPNEVFFFLKHFYFGLVVSSLLYFCYATMWYFQFKKSSIVNTSVKRGLNSLKRLIYHLRSPSCCNCQFMAMPLSHAFLAILQTFAVPSSTWTV